jgi:MoxR-like ATPase
MMSLPAGDRVVDLIELAYRADIPVLLEGRHGVGKSALLVRAAQRLGIEPIVRDLSLMEPPDLVGIPSVGPEGRTRYAPPAFLPSGGRGLLAFEELNRSSRYMQASCLQLLTARRLNDYLLPAGWLPVASINEAQDGYQVEELDEALLSRFLRIKVVPDRQGWVSWGKAEGRMHTKILEFAEYSPGIFDEPVSNPRSWEYASRFLRLWEESPGRDRDLLAAALSRLVGEHWALAFLQFYEAGRRPLTATEVVDRYPAHRAVLRGWVGAAQLDLVAASLAALQRHLQPQRVYENVVGNPATKRNVERFFADLPAELRRQVRAWLKDRGFGGFAVRGVANE